MKLLIPAALALAAIALFFLYTDSAYQEVQTLQAEQARFDDALERSKELQGIRDALLSKYNTFSSVDIERLEKMLPDGIDIVRLILELDSVAARNGMRINNILIQESAGTTQPAAAIGATLRPYQTVSISFNVTAQYDPFMDFLKDLESSLRVVDVTTISFQATDDGSPYNYTVGLQTYWLN